MWRKISRERSLSCARLTSLAPIGTSWDMLRMFPKQYREPRIVHLADGIQGQAGLWPSGAAPKSTESRVKQPGDPMRPSRRQPDELRAVSLERGVVKYAEGSCFVKFGDTHVLATATVEDK